MSQHSSMEERNTDSMSTLATKICNQISSVFATRNTLSPLQIIVDEISSAAARSGKVFVHGVGREGLMMKALCMRLAHLGLSAHCVGDMTTPPITSIDLLIASAGPGGFSTVDAICGVAKANGGRVLVLTAQPETGSCMKYADAVAYVAAQTMANDHDDDDDGEVGAGVGGPLLLPMGSVYEGALFVLFEMVVYKLASSLGQNGDKIRSRHTNLECNASYWRHWGGNRTQHEGYVDRTSVKVESFCCVLAAKSAEYQRRLGEERQLLTFKLVPVRVAVGLLFELLGQSAGVLEVQGVDDDYECEIVENDAPVPKHMPLNRPGPLPDQGVLQNVAGWKFGDKERRVSNSRKFK
ncbi:sugar isomerase [Tanacetum coccineum]